MDYHQKKQLEQAFSQLTNNEQQKIMKKAAKLQKASRSKKNSEDGGFEKIRKSSKTSLALQFLQEEQPTSAEATGEEATFISSLGGGWCVISLHGQEQRVRAHHRLSDRLSPGDQVLVESEQIQGIRPRRTTLSRPSPESAQREKVIACNIDVVVVVSAWKNPPPRFGLIDRYLIAIQRGGAEAVLCFNKRDLCPDEERAQYQEPLSLYQSLNIPLVEVSAETKEGIEELRQHIQGKRVAFVGHSGVGKTSLRNALDPSHQESTRAVGRKGRHTTTSASLTVLPDGTEIFDTPGIRELGLWQVSAQDLPSYFPEFEPYLGQCRFSDCTHKHEPDCAIRSAVDDGSLPWERYRAYLRLSEEAPNE